MNIWDAIESLVCNASVTVDDDDGMVTARDEETGRERSSVVQLGLPGVYARAASGVRGFLMRTRAGGILFGTETIPPGDAVVGEAGIHVGDSVVRVKPDGEVEIKSVSGTTIIVDAATGDVTIDCATGIFTVQNTTGFGPGVILDDGGLGVAVARDNDVVQADVLGVSPMAAWIALVSAALFIPNPTSFGRITASSTKVTAG